ncbi:MAG TPA: CHAD domain-containing protein, partial [Methanomassiliicoccales archaeon]|nr:CHAD domain-containing protein [Methanomassiliicoccales archaeon]
MLANADVECVHRMRVASRRMRAALVVFEGCFPRKRFRRWSKQMKLVTRALGAARDADVQIIYLKELRSRSNDEQMPGVAQLIEAKIALRGSLQKELEGALKSLMEGRAIDEMDRATRPDIKEDKGRAWRRSRALAYLDLLHRTTELRSYAPHVHSEGAKEKHHQMRIAAKHLRYTIEIFRNLYKDRLAEELNATKRLQEILGEMHDCDVWEDEMAKLLSLPEMGEEALRIGYAFVLKDRKEFRALNYRAFVALWDGMEEKGLFRAMLVSVEKSAEAALRLEERTEAELELRPETKVAIIGDVHANLHALRAVLEDAERRGANIVINTGDSVGYGPNPEETLMLLQERKANSVAGNFDLKVLRAGPLIKAKREGDKWYGLGWTYRRLSKSGRDYLRSLPRAIRFEAAGRTILITHGSPDSMDEYVGPQTPRRRLEQLARSSRADIMITGHAHRAFDAVVGGTRFINSGSVGRQ